MKYTLEELNPANPILEVNKKEIELSLLTLEIEVKLKEKYGSLDKAMDNFAQDLVGVIWLFIINKDMFNTSKQDFYNFTYKGKEAITDTAKKMVACFYEAVDKSRPIIKNKKRMEDIQKMRNINTDEIDTSPCYASYFDTVASRYPYTLSQFYELTLRQLSALLQSCGDGRYEDLEIQAALAGRKLQPRMKMVDVSEEEEKDQERDAAEAVKRLQEQYEKNKGKKG